MTMSKPISDIGASNIPDDRRGRPFTPTRAEALLLACLVPVALGDRCGNGPCFTGYAAEPEPQSERAVAATAAGFSGSVGPLDWDGV